MFDQLVDATTGTRGAGTLSAWARVENAACARRVAAMAAMLDEAHALSGAADRDQWCLDNFDAVAAHVGAAQRITSGAASHQLLVAVALHERFPRVADVFADGLITYQLVRTVVTRAALVVDPDALRALDASLADAFGSWEPMSVDKTEKTIDALVAQVDPQAVRRTETKARSRSVEITIDEDGSGLATLYATLFAHDAKTLQARLRALAATVCPADPRTADQLRADAFGAGGNDRMACLCGTDDCPAAQNPPATGVVVYVIASEDTISGPAPEPETPAPTPETPAPTHKTPPPDERAALDGDHPPLFDKPLRDLTLTAALTPTPGALANLRPAAMMGGQFLPGCRMPATQTDIDHTIPWPHGPTAASNLKCPCRRHHLLKTFWGGENGWRDRQLDDGTVLWTAPDGREHLTTPGSRLLFPELSAPTTTVTITGRPTPHTTGLTMPRRRTTRAHDRTDRVHRERMMNDTEG
ncbi:DUF222 domain-containing protein [Mycobacterium sp. NPDC006124]|uniref:HNH endonuclease signature motif containing protein n=1 Tax=Mycobacterium sp. NPDC006124 TaxID=3156729 RepID=UPI0033AA6609